MEPLNEFWREMASDPTVAGVSFLPTDENIARRQKFIMKVHEGGEHQVLVAEMDGKIVGYVFFLKREEFPLETTYAWASMNEIHVHPAYRKRGNCHQVDDAIFRSSKINRRGPCETQCHDKQSSRN